MVCYTVEPPYNDQPRGNAFWPLYRGGFAEGFSSVQLKAPFMIKTHHATIISAYIIVFFNSTHELCLPGRAHVSKMQINQ